MRNMSVTVLRKWVATHIQPVQLNLMHWGLVTHISMNSVITSSGNGLLPIWHQAISWTSDDVLLIGPFKMETSVKFKSKCNNHENVFEIIIGKIETIFPWLNMFKDCHGKTSSPSLCLGWESRSKIQNLPLWKIRIHPVFIRLMVYTFTYQWDFCCKYGLVHTKINEQMINKSFISLPFYDKVNVNLINSENLCKKIKYKTIMTFLPRKIPER